ncbi:MAG: hypothetical protein IPI58_09120 [Alphaproteobacteria bacterium]|nr:MAG: hypothetical protein IPI58_09120 [Alphaproteobacteria bacterium]
MMTGLALAATQAPAVPPSVVVAEPPFAVETASPSPSTVDVFPEALPKTNSVSIGQDNLSSLPPPLPPAAAQLRASTPSLRGADVPESREIAVETLAPPLAEAAGLLDPSAGGLSSTLWRDTSRHFVETSLNELATLDAPPSPFWRALAHRLAASTGAPPEGDANERVSRSLISLRAQWLLGTGAPDMAKALAERLPRGTADTQGDEPLWRVWATASILEGQAATACDRLPDFLERFQQAFWGKLSVLCHLRVGKLREAQLGATLLADSSTPDLAFIDLAHALTLPDKALPRAVTDASGKTPLDALHVALLRLLDLPLPHSAWQSVGLESLGFALPMRAADGASRVLAAERMALHMGLDARELMNVYRDYVVKPDVLSKALAGKAQDAMARAALYQAAGAAKDADTKGKVTSAFLTSLSPAEAQSAIGEVAETLLEGQAPSDDEESSLNSHAARVLLIRGRMAASRPWYEALAREGATSTKARQQAYALWPLAFLAGFVRQDDMATWAEGVTRESGGGRAVPLADILTVFEALGFGVSDDMWLDAQAARNDDDLESSLSPSISTSLGMLARAAPAGRQGQTVLLVLSLLREGPGKTPIFITARAIMALRAVGLSGAAADLAREALAERIGGPMALDAPRDKQHPATR